MHLSLLLLPIVCLTSVLADSSEEDFRRKPKKWMKMRKFQKGPDGFPGMPMMPMLPEMPMIPEMPMMPMPDIPKGPDMPRMPMRPPPFRGKFTGMRTRVMRLPPFIQLASEDNRKAISEVMGDKTLSIEEKDTKIEEILKTDSPAAQEAFARFKTDMAARRARMEKEMMKRREKLSPGAKEADESLTKIMKDTTLSKEERMQQLKELFSGLPEEIQQELIQMRRGYKRNKVAMKIREVGDFIGGVRMGIHDALRSAIGLRPPMTNRATDVEPVRRAPMRRLPPKYPATPDLQLETKPIAISDDGNYLEI